MTPDPMAHELPAEQPATAHAGERCTCSRGYWVCIVRGPHNVNRDGRVRHVFVRGAE